MRLRDLPDDVNKISGHVLDAAIKVHSTLGPGLLENVYKWCLCHELSERGFRVEREVPANVQDGSYVRLLDKPLGILLNFHAARIYSEEGFRRRANRTKDQHS